MTRLVTEAQRCIQPAQGRYTVVPRPAVEPASCPSRVWCFTVARRQPHITPWKHPPENTPLEKITTEVTPVGRLGWWPHLVGRIGSEVRFDNSLQILAWRMLPHCSGITSGGISQGVISGENVCRKDCYNPSGNNSRATKTEINPESLRVWTRLLRQNTFWQSRRTGERFAVFGGRVAGGMMERIGPDCGVSSYQHACVVVPDCRVSSSSSPSSTTRKPERGSSR